MELMVAEIFLKAFALCALLFLVARHEADFSFSKVVIVTAGITLGSFFIELALVDRIGVWTVFPVLAFFLFMIVRFCWVPFWKAVVVAMLFMAFNIALAAAVQTFLGNVNKAVDKAVEGVRDQSDMQQAMEAFKDVARAMGVEGAPPPTVPAAAASAPASAPAPAAAPSEPSDSPGWAQSKTRLKVTANMEHSGRKVVVVNGQLMEEGQTIDVKHQRETYTWKVRAITRDGVDWERVSVR